MKKSDVIAYFGTRAATARALRLHENSVRRWPDVLTDHIAYKIELATNGALKTDETKRILARIEPQNRGENGA